jgi:hypothetical protein
LCPEAQGKADEERREGCRPRRYVAFHMVEVAISKNLFAEILRMIAKLRPRPVASTG